MVRFNITVPDKVAQKLRKVGNKSRFISEAVEEKIAIQEKDKKIAILVQEYKEMAMENKTFQKEWAITETEGWE